MLLSHAALSFSTACLVLHNAVLVWPKLKSFATSYLRHSIPYIKTHENAEGEENGCTSRTRPCKGVILVRDMLTPVPYISNPSFRLWLFLTNVNRAMQTGRFTILLKPVQKSFCVLQSLLIQQSSVFEKMCYLPFTEFTKQVIRLPKKDTSTFEHFFI